MPALPSWLLPSWKRGTTRQPTFFFAQDPGGLGAVQDLLSVLPDEVLSEVPEWAGSPDGTWVGLSGRARTVVYNPQRVSEDELPDDIWGFVNPEWKDRIGWAPTNASFQTMITVMHTLWGEEKTKEWLLGVQANNQLSILKTPPGGSRRGRRDRRGSGKPLLPVSFPGRGGRGLSGPKLSSPSGRPRSDDNGGWGRHTGNLRKQGGRCKIP